MDLFTLFIIFLCLIVYSIGKGIWTLCQKCGKREERKEEKVTREVKATPTRPQRPQVARVVKTPQAAKAARFLFFDTETTGLPKRVGGMVIQPRLVQLACLLTDSTGNELDSYYAIVRPEGYQIPYEAERIHGISTAKALAEGVSMEEAVHAFISLYDQCDALVAHNISFDKAVMRAEIDRLNAWGGRPSKKDIDTMKPTSAFVGIPSPWGGYKWPKLAELHQKLFGKDFEGAHDALADVKACARCYFECVKRGILPHA